MVSTIDSLAKGNNIDARNISKSLSFPKNSFTGEHPDLKKISINHEQSIIALARLLDASKLVGRVNYKLNSTRSAQEERHNVVINFSLAEQHHDKFALLRGLFDFYSNSAVAIIADRAGRSFSVEIKENESEKIDRFFNFVLAALQKEINFKTVLKKVIRLEQQIKNQQYLAYESLRATL